MEIAPSPVSTLSVISRRQHFCSLAQRFEAIIYSTLFYADNITSFTLIDVTAHITPFRQLILLS